MTEQLKPCPFCGGLAKAYERTCDKSDRYDPSHRAYPIVRCGSCGCCAEGKDWTEPDTAIKAWNRRAQPAQAGAEPVAWTHDCAALLTNDVELWIDACPHCGKPRTSPHLIKQMREPSTDGVLIAVEESIRNGGCPWQIEQAFDEYEAKRRSSIKEGS